MKHSRRLLITGLLMVMQLDPWNATAQTVRELPQTGDARRVNELLDEPMRNRIEVKQQPFRKALEEMQRISGLSFVVDDATLELLPYGQRTSVDIRIQGITLRSGLQSVCLRLGLAFEVSGGAVRIFPGPLLERLGRRIQPEEATLLQRLHGETARTLFKGDRVRLTARGNLQEDDAEDLIKDYLKTAGNQSAYDALESIAASSKVTWLLDGEQIVLLEKAEDFTNRLNRRVDLNVHDRLVDQVLVELGQSIGVPVEFDAGVQQQLVNNQVRVTDLFLKNTEARQALGLVCGRAGLAYRLTDLGMRIGLQPGVPMPTAIVQQPSQPQPAVQPSAPSSPSPSGTSVAPPVTVQPSPAGAGVQDLPSASVDGAQVVPPSSGTTHVQPVDIPMVQPPTSANPLPVAMVRRIVAVLRVPIGTDGTTIDFLLYEDELPSEFAEMKRTKIPVIIERVRSELGMPAAKLP